MQVVFISGKAQHGKDTCARFLQSILSDHGKRVLVTHYGDLLKYICRQFFGWDGKKDENGRAMLQHIGTDVIRSADPGYWVNFTQSILNFFPDAWDFVLIPDCRFPNEVDTIKGIHLRVERRNFESPLTKEQQGHPSETALDNHPCDHLIINDGTQFQLRSKLEKLAVSMGWIEKAEYSGGQPINKDFCRKACMAKDCALWM